jgi:hypothetical protein
VGRTIGLRGEKWLSWIPSDGEQRLVGFERGRWVGLPAADALLRGGYERICWRKDDAWLFRLSANGGRSILEAYWLKGTLEKTITGPMLLETWPGSVFCWNLAVSADGTIAMDSRHPSCCHSPRHPIIGGSQVRRQYRGFWSFRTLGTAALSALTALTGRLNDNHSRVRTIVAAALAKIRR